MIHGAEKSLKEHGEMVGEEERTAITTAIEELREVTGGDDAEAIQAKSQTLAEASMKLGEAIYKQSQDEDSAAAEADAKRDGGSPDDDVVDADFEDVTDGDDGRKAS